MIKQHFKRFICLVVSIIIIMGMNITVFGSGGIHNNTLQNGYNQLYNRAKIYGIPFSMKFEEYVSAFYESGFNTEQEYANAYLGLLEPSISNYSSLDSNKWYYNTGTSLPSNANPQYNTYNLYNTAKKGDIIFEANGGFGITGHIAIVEGKYYNAAKKLNYIRIIEAINVGVVRSCIDDTRVNDKNVTLLRVNGANATNIDNAVSFCVGAIGASYSLDFAKDTNPKEKDWYCSELVWASYKNQGIDIEVSGLGEPGITPRDILKSAKVKAINFK